MKSSDPNRAAPSALDALIRSEIATSGVISFARFMELALYHPQFGYYERHLSQTGRDGDFITNVSIGSLYGELLGFEFSRRLNQLGGENLVLIESGAHDGQLARDLLVYLSEFQTQLFQTINYVIIEPSPRHALQQRQTLSRYEGKVRWVQSWEEVGEFRGICFSNELLDAMPVHVFRWDTSIQDWVEWGVTVADHVFQWKPLPPAVQDANPLKLLARLPAELRQVIPDQFAVEISPHAVSWWLEAAHRLTQGWLLTVDYGFTQEEFLLPHRAAGTLRTYSGHRSETNLFEEVGEKDITAHVNFSLVIAAGESAGLKTEIFSQQGAFIKSILQETEKNPGKFPPWTPTRYRQLTSLMHPEHLGRASKVLAQSRSDPEV